MLLFASILSMISIILYNPILSYYALNNKFITTIKLQFLRKVKKYQMINLANDQFIIYYNYKKSTYHHSFQSFIPIRLRQSLYTIKTNFIHS